MYKQDHHDQQNSYCENLHIQLENEQKNGIRRALWKLETATKDSFSLAAQSYSKRALLDL